VTPEADPGQAGDEPVLLARRAGCPVWRGTDRGRAARSLLAAQPQCDVIVSDDGLQHYRLARDIEIALIDGTRGLGNGLPIPAGPMREPARRLERCDFVVVKAPRRAPIPWRGETTDMTLRAGKFVNLRDPNLRAAPGELAGTRVHAVAGIGQPDQFFDTLRALGLEIVEHPFADHHAFSSADFAFDASATIVMTEKDAVKCAAFASEGWWMLPVEAELPPGFAQRILARLPHGPRSETA
jgi:tetraacyldisaccharide 4'-kinase